MQFKKIEKCRISDSTELEHVLDLGLHPLANSLKSNSADEENNYPLSLSFCPESSLLQLNETVDKEKLFEHYVWVTGTSTAAKEFSVKFAEQVIENVGLKSKDLLIEIASNDGTFLKPFLDKGYSNILGVDPAKNVAEMANNRGIKTLPAFWSSEVAQDLSSQRGEARVVFARNVIPHVSELLDVIAGIELILGDEGVGIIEFHDAGIIQTELQYDSIYHEHLCYFSIKSMEFLLKRFNLIPFHIERSPISGGAWVIYFSKSTLARSKQLNQAMEREESHKINVLSSWQNFASRAKEHRNRTLQMLEKVGTKKVVGFGSSARSQTYLNFCGVHSGHMNAIIDNNPLKQGLFAPGSSIPIVDFEKGMAMNPELIFILAWNFKNEIVNECKQYGYKGQFLVSFPDKPYITDGR